MSIGPEEPTVATRQAAPLPGDDDAALPRVTVVELELEEASITRIQAHVRGGRVRRFIGPLESLRGLCKAPCKVARHLEGLSLSAESAGVLFGPVKAAALRTEAVISEALRTDMSEVKQALENHLEFPFLASDTHPMHGLQDWSTTEWATHIQRHPELSSLLAQSLLSAGHGSVQYNDPCELALQVKEALRAAQPLSRWRTVIAYQNACLNAAHELDDRHEAHEAFYMSPGLLSNALFRRDFPLGVDKRVAQYRWRFAIENSGLAEIRHRESRGVERALIACLVVLFGGFIGYFLNYALQSELWTLESTKVDGSEGDENDVAQRTKYRGIVASILTAFTYSGTVNSSLDKFGKIDPATSTVLIGMFLGNTFNFLLDTMIASDEGLREYLWSPQGGMRYALGSLASDRFGRYLITIIFDMFFMVILFKHGYSILVQMAGFSKNGREWMANAVVSSAIGILTFVVYANMTRFEWAYPSGSEDTTEQWIQGPTMLLAVVVMNMVYLTSETRVRMDEPGINDPPIKLLVTAINFFILYMLQENGVLDPSETPRAQNITADWRDISLPLKGVCESQARYGLGIAIFAAITVICLGGVIFGTSPQTLTEIRAELGCCSKLELDSQEDPKAAPRAAVAPAPAHTSSTTSTSTPPPSQPSSARVSRTLKRQSTVNTVTFASNDAVQRAITRKDLARGKFCLFFTYLFIVFVLMLIFACVPFYSDDNDGVPRNETGWRKACDNNDVDVLDLYGLS